jgi:hypothetical protein
MDYTLTIIINNKLNNELINKILYFFYKYKINLIHINEINKLNINNFYIFYNIQNNKCNNYYPILNFYNKLNNLILNVNINFCYLSKCKNIYFVRKKNILFENNIINIKKEDINNILFEFNNINELDHIIPPNELVKNDINTVLEYLKLLKLKDINYDNFINNNISYKSYIMYLKNNNNKYIGYYNIILFIENINQIYEIILPKYNNYRITIFHNIKIKEDFDLLNAFCNKNKILFNLYLKKNWIWFFNINNKRLLWFEKVILTTTFNLNFFDLLNKYHKIKNNLLFNKYISIDASDFVSIPLFNNNNNNKYLSPLKIFNIIKNYIYNHNYKNCYTNIKLKLIKVNIIKNNNNFIQNQLLLVRNYPKIITYINIEINKNYNSKQVLKLLTKKVSISILCCNEKELLNDINKIIYVINDHDFLCNLVLLFNNIQNKEIMNKLYIKILKLGIENKFSQITLICFQKILISISLLDEESILVLFDFIIKIKELNLIEKSNLKKIIISLFYSISKFIEKEIILNKFNLIINDIFDLNDILTIDKLLNIKNSEYLLLNSNNDFNNIDLSKSNENIGILHFLIFLTTNFSAYYNTFNEFINKRNEIKKNIEYLLTKDIPICSLDKVLCLPVCNFFLSYQGLSSVNIFKLKSQLIRKICPELNYNCSKVINNNKINICFHSNFLNRCHSVFKDRHQIIKHMSYDNKFNVYFSTFDKLLEEVKYSFGDAKHIILPLKLCDIKNKLEELKLDVLVYCEIGMDPRTYFMAFMRLAKIQINTWGHSDTSGIDTIDYFISSKLYELDYNESQLHYSEQLILQNSLCTYYINPLSKYNINTFKNRYDYGFSDEIIIYFCAQSLFKFNPLFDEYIISILQSVDNCIILLLENDNKQKLIKRFNNKKITNKIHFISGMNHNNYINLMNIADVILDPYPFGGCNSSLEGFSLGKVIVTQSSEMINGRFTTGFYKKMNLDELICKNKNEYINLSIKLGINKKYRLKYENKIKEKNSDLFNDNESINEWTNTIIDLVNK